MQFRQHKCTQMHLLYKFAAGDQIRQFYKGKQLDVESRFRLEQPIALTGLCKERVNSIAQPPGTSGGTAKQLNAARAVACLLQQFTTGTVDGHFAGVDKTGR